MRGEVTVSHTLHTLLENMGEASMTSTTGFYRYVWKVGVFGEEA